MIAEPDKPEGESRKERGYNAPGGNRFLPGNPGRPKGAKDGFTRKLREEWLEAYKRRGGVEYLLKLDDRLFMEFGGKLIPRERDDDESITITAADIAAQVLAMREGLR